MPDATSAPAGTTVQNFSIAVDRDDGSTGLTQDMQAMEVDAPVQAMEVDAPAVPQVGAGRHPSDRRARRRVNHDTSWMLLRCTMCQNADAFQARDSRGLMQHLARTHLGQALREDMVAQLRALDKEACRICSSIRARTTPHCTTCGCATATRPLQLGDIVPDRRRGDAQGIGGIKAPTQGSAFEARPNQMVNDSDSGADHAFEVRQATLSESARHDAQHLNHTTLLRIPKSVASQMPVCKAEALEGAIPDYGNIFNYFASKAKR